MEPPDEELSSDDSSNMVGELRPFMDGDFLTSADETVPTGSTQSNVSV